MKLSASLILLSFVFGINCAVTPGRSKFVSAHPSHGHGGITHPSSNSIPSGKRNNISPSIQKQAGSSSGAHSRNGTADDASRWDSDSVANFSTSMTVRRPQKTPIRTMRRHKRVYSDIGGRRGLKTSASVYTNAGPASVMTTSSEGASVKNDATVKKTEMRSPSATKPLNNSPTPSPTGSGSSDTTVHINDENDFALLLPKNSGELISDAETDGISYCTQSGCSNTFPDGFITAAAVTRAPDNSSWIQVTGCLDLSKSSLSQTDDGGQFDVRFPNGAQCSFGGYGASFIEQVEPSANRFCLRCCADANDQTNCNSHQDRAGCPVAIPGIYDFPDKGISCS